MLVFWGGEEGGGGTRVTFVQLYSLQSYKKQQIRG